MARNIVIDQARARAARPAEVAAYPSDEPATSDPSDEVVDAVAMTGLLAELPADHRQVLVELYYRGRTMTEAAAALGIPAGTVKSRSYHALRNLRRRINPATIAG